MAGKRTRAAFEADLQAQQSPYALYGTPLPPLDASVRDDGSYAPIWKQEVTDDRGRKRLHGAFTGGFSAGSSLFRYFNTVGSKEGWTPATFVSSRQNRAKDNRKQQIEDFMDEEDIREAEEAKTVSTNNDFAGFGTTDAEMARRGGLMDLLKTTGETMGVKLLKKMGWREGQGVGPKVRRRANLGDGTTQGGEDANKTYFFAPENPPMVAFIHKTDHKGLGFQGEARLDARALTRGDSDGEEDDSFFGKRLIAPGKPKQPKAKETRRGGFGVGVLNDTGSDDEDPYSIGPQISYNRVIGGDKKKKKKAKSIEDAKPVTGSSNPLITNKPVYIPKKVLAAKSSSGFRKCHDGRLPLEGFLLVDGISNMTISTQEKKYAAPEIPAGWKSNKTPAQKQDVSNEKAPKGYELSEAQKRKDLWDLVPKLDKQVAVQALTRAASGWMPYSEDLEKRKRYRAFLEVRAGLRDTMPDRVPGSTTDEWALELDEFARAAEVFKPMSGLMASRFTSASSGPRESSDKLDATSAEPLLSKPAAKPEDPAVEAARIGMFGPMTRSTISLYPTRLLCKRFNVKPPDHVQIDPGEATGRADAPPSDGRFQSAGYQNVPGPKELVSREVMNQLLVDAGRNGSLTSGAEDASSAQAASVALREPVVIEPERNEALEAERPGEAVFKAIFGSDDEDEDEELS
ncbi:DUF1604-domain-containing protein [Aspergillus indologenus CBS 114.80]|uniref:DUF1604-domain-containing protein n=1 Tax=Aspergillus indologenus CBS 114.80 TaxID=1450541 RepID=A0A2V5INV4_9EURO|nr:DUF1604-domain-containing protein [Aspergillus indologenus CBS 114.80]